MRDHTKTILAAILLGLALFVVAPRVAYSSAPLNVEAPAAAVSVAVSGRTTAAVNLRPEPSTLKPRITVIPAGATIQVDGRNAASTWVAVTYQGKQGWVYALYVRLSSGVVQDLPVVTALPTAPAAAPTSAPATTSGAYNARISNVSTNVNAIYARGQQLGNRPNAFSRIGDCEMEFKWFLRDFDAGVYDLGPNGYLSTVIQRYGGSFERPGLAANSGMSSTAILQDIWADPKLCQPGETPLACEYRIHRPSVALIMLRTIDHQAVAGGKFHSEVTQIVQMTAERGVIPVLQTIPYWGEVNPSTAAINEVIRRVAAEQNVPLWDYNASADQLPNRGVTGDYHINQPADGRVTFFTGDYLQYGAPRRNLEALEVLHAILAQVN